MRLNFPAYRQYREARVAASDALMALLIGARLGQHALSNSPANVTMRLPQLFGRIEGIERVNLTVGDAARLLREAEQDLAFMGIPYVLGVHSAYLAAAVTMLREDGRDDESAQWAIPWRPDPTVIPLDEAHEYIQERCGRPLPADLLALFHIARRIRNRIIHFAGVAGPRLPGEYRSLRQAAKMRWEKITGRGLTIDPRGKLILSDEELIAVLSVTRHLAAAVNESLAATISRPYWARVVIADYRALAPQRSGEEAQRQRRLAGHARTHYRPLEFSDNELRQAYEEDVLRGGSSY